MYATFVRFYGFRLYGLGILDIKYHESNGQTMLVMVLTGKSEKSFENNINIFNVPLYIPRYKSSRICMYVSDVVCK